MTPSSMPQTQPARNAGTGGQPRFLAARARDDAGKGQDAADRQVEHAADHQHHHAAGEDAGLRGVEQHDGGVAGRREGVGPKDRHSDDEGDDQPDQQQRPVGGDTRRGMRCARCLPVQLPQLMPLPRMIAELGAASSRMAIFGRARRRQARRPPGLPT